MVIPEPPFEPAPYERVIFNSQNTDDDRARAMLFGGARAQFAVQQHDSTKRQTSTQLMHAAQLPNQRRQTAIGIQATSSSSGSENDSASYSQGQPASKSSSGSGYHHQRHRNPPPAPPPPLSLQSLQQPHGNIGAAAQQMPVDINISTRMAQDPRISAVLHAISNGRVGMLRSIWSSDLPLYVDEHKNTVLHWCAKYEGAAKCLKWLIKYTQVPLSARNFRGELCTHVAARHGVLSCLKVALMSSNLSNSHASEHTGSNAGTDRLFSATEKDKRGFTVLHLAVIKQRFPIVRWLTKQTFAALLVRIADNNNNLALHYAALRGSKKMAQLLLKRNRDMLNLRNISGATPLHVAAFEGHSVAFVQWLVEEVGADATAVMESGVNLLHVAAAGGSITVVRYLLSTTRQPAEAILSRSQDGSTVFHFSAANGHSSLLQWLWSQRGNNLSRTGNSHNSSHHRGSPLSNAIAAGIHLRNTSGNSPVHAAAEAGQAGTFRQLVEFGADIFGKNKSGYSALELALASKNPALVRLSEDIRRLLMDPAFTPASSDEGYRNQPISPLANFQSTLTSAFNDLTISDQIITKSNQYPELNPSNKLQMQLFMSTGELGTIDNENEEEENGSFVVRRVNDNVFLKQDQNKQRAPSSVQTWKEKIFPQKYIKRQFPEQPLTEPFAGTMVSSVPELTTLMKNRGNGFLRNQSGNDLISDDGDYWNRLSNDIRRLIATRR